MLEAAPRVILWGGRRPPARAFDDDAIVVDYQGRAIWRWRQAAWLTPTGFRLAAALLARSPHHADYSAIVEALYGDRADGGPDAPLNIIGQMVLRHRHGLARLGITIETVWGYGLRAVAAPAACSARAA